MKVVLNSYKTIRKELKIIPKSVYVILVKKNSAAGAIKVDINGSPNIVINLNKRGVDIIIIKPGQTCRFYLTFTMRYFKSA
jgi:hypothetical protein